MIQAQSYYSAILKAKLSIYDVRILSFIVERAHTIMIGKGAYSQWLNEPYCTDGLNCNFALSISSIAGKTHNYKGVYKALDNLQSLVITYYNRDKRLWMSATVINNIVRDDAAGIVHFTCAKWFIDFIADFRNGGFRLYEKDVVMSLRNVYSSRLYIMLSSVMSPITYNIAALRNMLGLEGKYAKVSDFIRRIIEPSKKELDNLKVNSFKYELIRNSKEKAHSKITSIKFIPIKNESKDKNIGEQKKRLQEQLPELFRRYLQSSCHFSETEILRNRNTIMGFSNLPKWEERFIDIVDRARRKRKGKGYIISAMKGDIKEYKSKSP